MRDTDRESCARTAERSELMSRVRQKNTKPEIVVRQLLHGMGYRFRLHYRELPGTPDVVFPGLRKAIFVHGCFWHRHPGCRRASTPKTRGDFWQSKFAANQARDARKIAELEALGWTTIVVWECEIRDADLPGRMRAFLEANDVAIGKART
jgi:DNA mismatch endonuclease (patch repair protein)